MRVVIEIPDDDYVAVRCCDLIYFGRGNLARSVTKAFQNSVPYIEPEVKKVPIANIIFDKEKLKELTNEIVERIKKGEIVLQYQEWIPVTTRLMTEDEEKEACERWGVDHLEDNEKHIFTCSLPDEGQEILISTHWGVRLDKCDYDPDYGFGLEENGDWDGVLAWMPLPEPYKSEGQSDDT
jgi:hypothetical protein